MAASENPPMKILALTGSIGMGKSATARLFAEAGIPVFDSDACVHELYAPGGAAVAPVEAEFPGVVREGTIDRDVLARQLREDESGFERLEAIVHPLVAASRNAFLDAAVQAGQDMVLLDIPLLFETGGDTLADIVIVVSAPDDIRRERVLQRPGMTPEKLDSIIARQIPDSIKRSKADYVITTADGIDDARRQVDSVIGKIRAGDCGGADRRGEQGDA